MVQILAVKALDSSTARLLATYKTDSSEEERTAGRSHPPHFPVALLTVNDGVHTFTTTGYVSYWNTVIPKPSGGDAEYRPAGQRDGSETVIGTLPAGLSSDGRPVVALVQRGFDSGDIEVRLGCMPPNGRDLCIVKPDDPLEFGVWSAV